MTNIPNIYKLTQLKNDFIFTFSDLTIHRKEKYRKIKNLLWLKK